jgi:hypothetical protein
MKNVTGNIHVRFQRFPLDDSIFPETMWFLTPLSSDTYDNHLFHIMIQNNLIYLAMTTNDFERRIAFAFLEKIRFIYCQNVMLRN